MPPKLRGPLPRSLSRLADTGGGAGGGGLFYCPSCATWRRALSTTTTTTKTATRSSSSPRRGEEGHHRRPASTLATSSAINVGRTVPDRFRELYDALDRVRETAAEQVSLSRLQLAQRGLESEEPVIRVAVLGLNDAAATRKLVRLLLADPLKPREEWEDILDSFDAESSRGLLIRYGEQSEIIPSALVPTLTVPSTLLKKGNIEILVTSLGAGAVPPGGRVTADTFLVPTVTIRTSHSGRHNVIRYPVHRSIVCGRGVDGLLAYSGLISRSNLKKDAESVHGAIDLGVRDEVKGTDRVSFVDIDLADEALAKFRESVQNATAYERGWNGSGVQPLVDWLSATRNNGKLNPALETLIGSLLDAAEEGVQAKEAQRLREQEAATVSDEVRENLDQSVTVWAERAHTELRDALEEAFASKRWRGLAWWKLFWRVDDVGMVTSEILERSYLNRAEREVIWTAGRFKQAGLLKESDDQQDLPVPPPTQEDDQTAVEDAAPASEQPQWPTRISTSRDELRSTTVPALQALAQGLVLFSFSTTTLTSALSALLYVSSTTGLYEAGTVAAVGLMYSLRRQQKKWESARTFWEKEVREEGRTALKDTEELLRALVRDGGRLMEDVTDRETRAAIERARKALADVKK